MDVALLETDTELASDKASVDLRVYSEDKEEEGVEDTAEDKLDKDRLLEILMSLSYVNCKMLRFSANKEPLNKIL